MTFLVAQASGPEAWMISDFAITDPRGYSRERIRAPKIIPLHRNSLLGFAGDPDLAAKAIAMVHDKPIGDATIEILLQAHRDGQAVDFAYVYLSEGIAKLFRIARGKCSALNTVHLGSESAFRKFQHLRHAKEIEPAPNSIHMFMAATSKATRKFESLDSLSRAVQTMWHLFPTIGDPSIGGCVLPFLLTQDGAEVFSYGYSVSDPVATTLSDGDFIVPGTSELGGFAVCVTRLPDRCGFAEYYLQQPGGKIYQFNGSGFTENIFLGIPSDFIRQVRERLGVDVELTFGDRRQAAEQIEVFSTTMLSGPDGQPYSEVVGLKDRSVVIIKRGNPQLNWRVSGKLPQLPEPKPDTISEC